MCVKSERMPLVVVIRGQTIQFPAAGAKMALATFMTHASTCSVGRGKRGWKTDEKTRQVRKKGGEPTRLTPGGKQIQRYDAAAMHPFRFQIKGQEVEMLCKSFALAQKMQSCFFSLWRHCGHFRTWTRFPELGVVPAVNAPPTLFGHLGLQSVPAL